MANPLCPPGTLHTPDTERTLKNRGVPDSRGVRKTFRDTPVLSLTKCLGPLSSRGHSNLPHLSPTGRELAVPGASAGHGKGGRDLRDRRSPENPGSLSRLLSAEAAPVGRVPGPSLSKRGTLVAS